jgi:uroporphyrinogen decarboxylase
MMHFSNRLRRGAERGTIPFVPAIYEHKASLIGRSPSDVCRDEDLLVQAHLAEFETYGSPLLVVGLDVYNIEPEAMGCEVLFHPDSNEVPVCAGPILAEGGAVSSLPLPDPAIAGRMPIMLNAARRIVDAVNGRTLVQGAVSGPVSLASELVGAQDLMMAMLTDPEWVAEVLSHAVKVSSRYARAFLDVGAEVSLFDSRATPDLISPALYRSLALPAQQALVSHVRDAGQDVVPLIIGGNVTPIAADLVRTGAGYVIADWTSDWEQVLRWAADAGVAVRVNLDPSLCVAEDPGPVLAKAKEVLSILGQRPNGILGTGVLPFDLPAGRLKAIGHLARSIHEPNLNQETR